MYYDCEMPPSFPVTNDDLATDNGVGIKFLLWVWLKIYSSDYIEDTYHFIAICHMLAVIRKNFKYYFIFVDIFEVRRDEL